MSPRRWRPHAALAVLAAGLLGCAAPAPIEASPTPVPEVMVAASQLPERQAPPSTAPPAPSGDASDAPATTTPAAAGTAPGPPDGPTPTSPAPAGAEAGRAVPDASSSALPATSRTLSTVADPRGDHGVEGPAYADLVAARLHEEGDDLVVEVQVGGRLPDVLAAGEVMGIGIDLVRGDDGESLYQVFIDAGSDGYRAYLQTPRGFVAFPGTLGLGADRLVARFPVSSVDTPLRGEWRVFLDWSEERLVLNAAASDRTPDRSWADFDRG